VASNCSCEDAGGNAASTTLVQLSGHLSLALMLIRCLASILMQVLFSNFSLGSPGLSVNCLCALHLCA
jgi:hypothetical protein